MGWDKQRLGKKIGCMCEGPTISDKIIGGHTSEVCFIVLKRIDDVVKW